MDLIERPEEHALQARMRVLQQRLDGAPTGRGAEVLALLRADFQRARAQVEQPFTPDLDETPTERAARLREQVLAAARFDYLYESISTYAADVGRNDIHVGISHAIDLLVDDLLGDGTDRLIHLVHQRMYSTLLLNTALPGRPPPVVINLPALEPEKAMLMPILAHEVAHAVVDRGALDLLGTRASDGGLADEILARAEAWREQGFDASAWDADLSGWLAELLCDSIATRLTGPSFVLALCSFVGVIHDEELTTHPPTALRLRLCLKVLEEMGWSEELQIRSPGVVSWLSEHAQAAVNGGGPRVDFLTTSCAALIDAIVEVGRECVARPLDHTRVGDRVQVARRRFDAGYPVVVLSGSAADVWEILAAAWLHVIDDERIGRVTEPATTALREMAAAPDETRFNSLLMSSLELSYVAALWSRT